MPNELLRRRFLLGLVPAAAVAAATTGQAGFNVRDHGAAGDGTQLDTKAIQAAVEAGAWRPNRATTPSESMSMSPLFSASRRVSLCERCAMLSSAKSSKKPSSRKRNAPR